MTNSSVCVDASFVLRLLTSAEPTAVPVTMWVALHDQGHQAVAPTLLFSEVVNALHRYVVRGQMPAATAAELLELALSLDIQLFNEADLYLQALRLAQEIALPAAYDSHYVALARRLGAALWTADQRLARAAASVVALTVVP